MEFKISGKKLAEIHNQAYVLIEEIFKDEIQRLEKENAQLRKQVAKLLTQKQ